ncbi:MAG: hypothetical protein HOV66_30535 [Streptomycetaceae bacterium]|nr:hypothetical protein [Streptomycetaceae bacterium]
MSAVQLTETGPLLGCAACGERWTVQLHPYQGRLCPRHAVLPTVRPGPFDRGLALDMVDLGRPDAALRYLRVWLIHEIDERFDAAVRRLAVAA